MGNNPKVVDFKGYIGLSSVGEDKGKPGCNDYTEEIHIYEDFEINTDLYGLNTIYSHSEVAPKLTISKNKTGRGNTNNGKTKIIYVPKTSVGYSEGYWKTLVDDFGFTISYTL